MILDDETVAAFKALYEQGFDESVSDEEAREIACRMLSLYRLLAGRGDDRSFE